MNTRTALHMLGVRPETLIADEKTRLDRDGYLALADVLSPAQVQYFRTRLDELAVAEGSAAGIEVHQEPGTDRLSDLVNKDLMFTLCLTHPRLLAAIWHVIRDELKLSSMNSRTALPGEGHQVLHVDAFAGATDERYVVCNSIWLFDDFTEANGATRVVPGSHRSGKMPHEALVDPAASHPDELKLIAPAGTVVVFNSHLWHGGTKNETNVPRHALGVYFTQRDLPQQLDQRAYIRPETYTRLGEAARYLLDV